MNLEVIVGLGGEWVKHMELPEQVGALEVESWGDRLRLIGGRLSPICTFQPDFGAGDFLK
ncbi:MAG: hypothetical protein ACRC8Y_23000 [Chroococcales cyanobacterium]